MKKLILFIAMMMLVACTQAPVEGDLSLKTIEDNGKMIVGFTEYPPMGSKKTVKSQVSISTSLKKLRSA